MTASSCSESSEPGCLKWQQFHDPIYPKDALRFVVQMKSIILDAQSLQLLQVADVQPQGKGRPGGGPEAMTGIAIAFESY